MEGYASVDFWLKRVESSRRNYQDHLNHFIAWLRTLESPLKDLSPDELIAYQKESRGYEILDLIQAYVSQLKTRASSKKTVYSVLKSFFAHNRAELPRDPRFTIRSEVSPVNGDLPAAEVKRILDSSNTTYKAIFLSMFQGALDLSGFEYWNLKGWPELKEQLDRDEKIVKISLPGRKKRRNETSFYTLIGSDAVTWIKHYLDEGSRQRDGTAIFYNKDGDTIRKNAVRLYWLRHLASIHLIERGVGGGVEGRGARYGKNLHELRDTFRSQWAKTHASSEVAEFLMGHDVDPLGYNKAMKDVDWVKQEYKEAQPMLQIWSGVAAFGYASRDETQRLRERVMGLEAETKARDEALKTNEDEWYTSLKMTEDELEEAHKKIEKLEADAKARDEAIETIQVSEDGRAETFDRLLEELRSGRAESDKRLAEIEERLNKRLRELRGEKEG